MRRKCELRQPRILIFVAGNTRRFCAPPPGAGPEFRAAILGVLSTAAPAPLPRAAAASQGRPPVPRAAWMRLAACTAAAALLQLDGTLITVALPTVAHGLDVKASSTSVVLSAYFGAYALVLMPGGELVDRFGVRRLALSGLALFAVGAAAGALVTSFGS